jgi:hypothetical protein
MKLQKIFGNKRIVGLAGDKDTGKTNNLVELVIDLRAKNKEVEIYAYGIEEGVMKILKEKYNVIEISSLRHLIGKKDCILLLDEFQKLKLNDRRYKDELDTFIDFIYHNNAYVVFSSPNIREFNSIIGGVIEVWLLKSVRVDKCINGSQLKKVIQDYKGKYKTLNSIQVPKDKLLVINDEEEVVIDCPYIEEVDLKKSQKNIFEKKSEELSEEKIEVNYIG